jgi:hypothetical protein
MRRIIGAVALCGVCGAAYFGPQCRSEQCRTVCGDVPKAAQGIGTLVSTSGAYAAAPHVRTFIAAGGTATPSTQFIDVPYLDAGPLL